MLFGPLSCKGVEPRELRINHIKDLELAADNLPDKTTIIKNELRRALDDSDMTGMKMYQTLNTNINTDYR